MNGLHNQKKEEKEIIGRTTNQSISLSSAESINKQKMANGIHNSSSPTNNDESKSKQLSQSDAAKKAAAFACGEAEVKSGMDIGVGSGTTMKFLIDWLREKQESGQIKDVRCVATSFQTRQWLMEAGLSVYELDQLNRLDLTIDGADEVDASLNCIKGGGGCLLQEKIIQTCAKKFAIIGGLDKYSEQFGRVSQTIPIEIAPLSYVPVQRWITEKHGGKCALRMDMKKCFPVLTENHNFILDWQFPKPMTNKTDWNAINQSLLCTPGVAETGLFVGVTQIAYFATPNGEIHRILPKIN